MKPLVDKRQIKKAKYKYHWYKNMIKLLRNSKFKNYRSDKVIHLT